jgi:hypothetical protein
MPPRHRCHSRHYPARFADPADGKNRIPANGVQPMLIDELAGIADPLPPALRDALIAFAEPHRPDLLAPGLSTVLPQFIRTGRPISALTRYVPTAPVASQLVHLLQEHPAARDAVVVALEYAHALHTTRLARSQASNRKDEAAAHGTMRRAIAGDLRLLERKVSSAIESTPELPRLWSSRVANGT